MLGSLFLLCELFEELVRDSLIVWMLFEESMKWDGSTSCKKIAEGLWGFTSQASVC